MRRREAKDRIMVVRGDITAEAVDAIVNAANRLLLGGGGLDGAIHRAAGPELLDACRRLGGCEPGEAKTTPGFRLRARFVIHTVGPVWHGGAMDEDVVLATCYRNVFREAKAHGVRVLAYPALATGAYGFPPERAAAIAVRETRAELDASDHIEVVRFVVFDDRNHHAYVDALRSF